MSPATYPPADDRCQTRQRTTAGSFNRRRLSIAAASLVALALGGAVKAAQAQAVQLVKVDVKAVGEGFQTSKLVGTKVQNDKGEKIGTLDDLIVTQDRNLFAVLQVGGFLGIGGHLIATPFESLAIADHGRTITLAGASKDALQKLPEFKYAK